MPLFSIVIPTYNRADLLPRCIDSVINQSFADFEVVIVDNYSEDNTSQLVADYQKNDSRIKYIQEHNNGVIAHSRNVGIRASKGDYVCLLDSDDWFAVDKLGILSHYIKENAPDLLYHKMRLVDEKGDGPIQGKSLAWNHKYDELLIKGNVIFNSSVCVKRSVLQHIGGISEDEKLKSAEDADCWLRIAKEGYNFFFIDKVLGFYWVGDNISSNINTLKQREYLYSLHINNLNGANKKKATRTLNYIRGIRYYEAGMKIESLNCYLKSIPMYSFGKTLKALIMVLKSIV